MGSMAVIRFRMWVLALGLSIASCANVPLTKTGFLNDYSALEPAPEHQVWGIPDTVELFRSDVLDSGSYDAIIVDPAEWQQGGKFTPGDENIAWLEEEFSKCLTKVIGKEFEVVTEPREGALRIRPAVTAVNPQNVLINVILLIVAVPLDMGGISGEIEVVDSMSGERVLAMRARREGNIFIVLESPFIYGHARHGMYKWSVLLRRLLQPQE